MAATQLSGKTGRRAAALIGAFFVAAFAWEAAGWLVRFTGIGELDMPFRAGAVFLLLTLSERWLARLTSED